MGSSSMGSTYLDAYIATKEPAGLQACCSWPVQHGLHSASVGRCCCSRSMPRAHVMTLCICHSAWLCAAGAVSDPGSFMAPGTYTTTGGGSYDLFVRKVNAVGQHVYTQTWGSISDEKYRCGGVVVSNNSACACPHNHVLPCAMVHKSSGALR